MDRRQGVHDRLKQASQAGLTPCSDDAWKIVCTRGNALQKFTELTGVAAPLPLINIDTDMIIPKQYLKTIKRTGLGSALFAEMRYREGKENPDFVLNRQGYRKASILIAGENFGCGSSREHAPWA